MLQIVKKWQERSRVKWDQRLDKFSDLEVFNGQPAYFVYPERKPFFATVAGYAVADRSSLCIRFHGGWTTYISQKDFDAGLVFYPTKDRDEWS